MISCKYDSWFIIDQMTAVKTCDKSFFKYKGTGIPKEICEFFGANEIQAGKKKQISLIYRNRNYDAYITNETTDRRRIRLFWNNDLGFMFLPYEKKDGVLAVFQKSSEISNGYIVSIKQYDKHIINSLEAKSSPATIKKKETAFYDWLNQTLDMHACIDITEGLNESEKYLRKRIYINKTLYALCDYLTIICIVNKICNDRALQIINKPSYNKILNSLYYYMSFLRKYEENSNNINGNTPVVSNIKIGIDQQFYNWLLDHLRLRNKACNEYVEGIRAAEVYAREHYNSTCLLFTEDKDSAIKLACRLMDDSDFKSIHFSYQFHLKRYLEFLGYEFPTHEMVKTESSCKETQITYNVKRILKEFYQYGFKLGSIRELLRFRQFAESLNINIPEDDDLLKSAIVAAGTVIEDKVYCLEDDLPQIIQKVVDEVFESGIRVVYYECLFEKEERILSKYNITSEEMLKEFLKKHISGYFFSKRFFTKGNKYTEKDAVTGELFRVWGDQPIVSVEDLQSRLAYIPLSNIWRVISGNDSFVYVSEGKYLLVDRFILNTSEEESILKFVNTTYETNGFASLSDIPLRDIVENNYELPLFAIYNAIYKKILVGKYHLNGRILTKDNPDLDVISLLKEYIRGKDELSLDEVIEKVYTLTGESNRQYAFQALYDEMIRVGPNRFVADRYVSFDVDEIDHILSSFITDHFAAIRDVTTFAMFPMCGQDWNHYLLESYCYRYSKKYNLHVIVFNDRNSGIICEKGYNLPYNEMLAVELVRANVDLTALAAGEHLSTAGYMVKSKFAMLDSILQRANEIKRDR